VHRRLQFLGSNREPFHRQGLVGEAHVHYGRGVPLRRGKVDQPTLGEQADTPSIREPILLHRGPRALAPLEMSASLSLVP
jgi:hypothetical protein